MKHAQLLFGAFLACLLATGQTDTTMVLNEVTVVDARQSFLENIQYQYKQDSVEQQVAPLNTIDNWLQFSSTTTVRQYVPGSATSFSMRGATSSQSAIIWQGIGINSSATGVTDLSVVPMVFFVPQLNFGGSSTFYGSGAIGGALTLGGMADYSKPFSVRAQQEVASFETYKTALQATFANQKWGSNTQFYWAKSKNNYPYTNAYRLPNTEEIREHAAYNQWHIKQDAWLKLNKNQKLNINLWYNKAERESANGILINTPSVAVLTDNYLRSNLSWQYATTKNSVELSYAFLYEWQTYSDSSIIDGKGVPLFDTNVTASHVVHLRHKMYLTEKWLWQNQFGARIDHVSGSNRTGNQQTVNAQSALLFAHNIWQAQLAVRAEYWDDNLLPISPWISAKVEWLKHVFASFYMSYVYKNPSLNDRFWVPGGNINLQPENGWTGEFAMFYEKQFKTKHVFVRANYYHSKLNNYIQWVPSVGGIWQPRNIKNVGLSGVDFNFSYSQIFGPWQGKIEGAYSYNQSVVKSSSLPGDASVNNQLIYQPIHSASGKFRIGYLGYFLSLQSRYVGNVNTAYDGSSQPIDAYMLANVSAAKTFAFNPISMTAIFAINNLTNQQYETVKYFPMPGINYSFTLKIDI